MTLKISPFALHLANWKDCTRCPLHETRIQTALYRGQVPCDILLIGEAPGPSENVLGEPFAGPAGHLLDQIVGQSGLGKFRLCFTNLVGCIPLEAPGQKFAESSGLCYQGLRAPLG